MVPSLRSSTTTLGLWVINYVDPCVLKSNYYLGPEENLQMLQVNHLCNKQISMIAFIIMNKLRVAEYIGGHRGYKPPTTYELERLPSHCVTNMQYHSYILRKMYHIAFEG